MKLYLVKWSTLKNKIFFYNSNTTVANENLIQICSGIKGYFGF